MDLRAPAYRRHPEVRTQRASKDDRARPWPSPFEARRASAFTRVFDALCAARASG